jgi:uncharacterized protein (DUF2235 family)
MASKCSIYCYDGAWNGLNIRPNVHWLAQHVEHDCTTQIVAYDRGVGIAWYDDMTGGACSIGLSRHVRQAHQFSFECYVPDDKISLFGCSRGAYTMRSLCGFMLLVGWCAVKRDKEQRHVCTNP